MSLSKEQLEKFAHKAVGYVPVSELSNEQIDNFMTYGMYLADLMLAEYERRGLMTFRDGYPVIPYGSDHVIPTILTRMN